MNDVILNEKNESMFFAIEMVLLLYCDFIYDVSYEFYDKAILFVENEEYVDHVLRVKIYEFVEDFEYYKRLNGTGREKLEDIDIVELRGKALSAYRQGVKDVVMKNLEANLVADEEGATYWKLKIFNNPI
ncbi:hypothetical protein [Citrobacter koseri]|uniref:hypothetical protein n=1 Tax=Citrobacter koseri TaxID=545 RepID=UPI003892B178